MRLTCATDLRDFFHHGRLIRNNAFQKGELRV